MLICVYPESYQEFYYLKTPHKFLYKKSKPNIFICIYGTALSSEKNTLWGTRKIAQSLEATGKALGEKQLSTLGQ